MKKINFSKLKNYYNEVIELHGFVDKVRDFVKENGGFISTTNSQWDTMYAYIVDWDLDIVTEERIIAVRVKDDLLQIIGTPYKNDVYEEDMREEDCYEEDWYTIGTYGDSVLTAQTILSMAESIDQYV
jgi:hypothetical protein